MKALKIIWYSLIALLFFAGTMTGRREIFLLMFIMGFVALYSVILNWWTVFSFSYLQKLHNPACVKGDETALDVEIHNETPVPFAFMRIEVVPVTPLQKAHFSFSLLPNSKISFTIPVSCPYRGFFDVGIGRLEINDSFGLVKTYFNMLRLPYYSPCQLKIYPKLVKLSVLPARRSDVKRLSSFRQQYSEQGDAYAGLRRYRPGDPLKRIHRAVSARQHELYVRTYDVPFETSVLILLDTSIKCDNEDGLYLADFACECAAAIVHHNLRLGHRVVCGCSDSKNTVLTLETMRDFSQFYDKLAVMEFSEQDDFSKVLGRIPVSAMQIVYIISARGGSGLSPILKRFNTENVKLISLILALNPLSFAIFTSFSIEGISSSAYSLIIADEST